MTNYERIKAMSVEEMAELLDDIQSDALFLEGTVKDLKYPIEWKKWLDSDRTVSDTQEVVRCKDCKHLMFSDMYGECSQAHMRIVRPDDFCSYGERKDENDR